MEKVEIKYSKAYFTNKLLIVFLNISVGLKVLIFDRWPIWVGCIPLLLGITLLVFYVYVKGKKFQFVLENGILLNNSSLRPEKHVLKNLEMVEKSKDSLTLHWEGREVEIPTYNMEKEGAQKLYSALRFYISNS